MILRFITLLFLFVTFCLSNTINITSLDTKISILENSYMYIDENSKLSFDEIKTKKFKPTDTNYLRLGYTSVTLWVKFTIKNNSNKNLKRYITLSNPMIDTIELYTKQDDDTFKKETQGILHLDLYDRNNILHPSFEVNFKTGETKEFYYKTHSLSCANYFKLFLKDHTQLYKDEFSYQLIETLLFGAAMIAFIVYNIFIFIFTKEIAYLYYVLFITFITINHADYSIMLGYISTNPLYTQIEAYFALYYMVFAIIFAVLFVGTILNIKQFKALYFFNKFFILIAILLMIASTRENYLLELSTYFLLFIMFYLLFVTIYAYYKKVPQAKYILLGWSICTIGLLSLAFKQWGIPNPIDYFPYFYELTAFLEAVLFSIALASKLNKTKELENSLKTNEVLTRELHHRVKNNMQFIILMYRLKLACKKRSHLNRDYRNT